MKTNMQQQLEARIRELEDINARLSGQIEVLLPLVQKMTSPSVHQPAVLQSARRQSTSWSNAIVQMTLKQRAVLFATLRGGSYSDIADAMGVDETTVKLHLKSALGKLGVGSRAELISIYRVEMIREIEASRPESLYSVPMDWMESRSPEVMEKLGKSRTNLPPPGGVARKLPTAKKK